MMMTSFKVDIAKEMSHYYIHGIIQHVILSNFAS